MCAQQISPRTRNPGCGRAGPQGPPLCPSSRRSPPAPLRSAAPPRRRPDPGNSQMGRYHPRAAGGIEHAETNPQSLRGWPLRERLPAGGGRGARTAAAGVSPPRTRARASRGPHALHYPPRPDGAMVRSAARTRQAGRAPDAGSSERWGQPGAGPVCPGALPLRSRAHPVRTRFGEVCSASFALFRREEEGKPQSCLSCLEACPASRHVHGIVAHVSQLNN